jgi:hypothetical protein
MLLISSSYSFGVIFAEPREKKGSKIYNYAGTNRVSRHRKKVFDTDLIDTDELPEGQIYFPTARGWKGGTTGQIYNQSWLAKKKGITLEELNNQDAVRKEASVPPHDPQYDILPGEEESYPYDGPTGLEPDDDAD